MERSVSSRFFEEATRVALLIDEILLDTNLSHLKEVIFCGHSLGGAVAAISEEMLGKTDSLPAQSRTLMFGAPRYCDSEAIFFRHKPRPIQIRRANDLVPETPPRWMGYVETPREFNTDGKGIVAPNFTEPTALNWAWFLLTTAVAHGIESYRVELGAACGAQSAKEKIGNMEKLSRRDIL